MAAPGTSAPAAVLEDQPVYRERLRLVTLGDGYTAATKTDAPGRDSWPAQLVHVINRSDMHAQLIAYNLASSGETSADVLRRQLPDVDSLQPDVVTLQVGINDIFTDIGPDEYRRNLESILDGLLEILPATRIFALTTPNHELSIRGPYIGPPGDDSAGVAAINDVLRDVAGDRGITVVDIAPAYAYVSEDPSMVVAGGPDPSARQYSSWAELIGRQLRLALSKPLP